ncbi:universal stress protein [Salipaludibacillus sp. CF4.18]|uniref:universal stress protein n=1 Tax=Salipaludibacillus sp. CF4.18 TaxID=3373081 RepID=UPI003EE75705
MFSKLLLTTDGSDHSHRAADKAIELAKLSGDASIEILYVIDGSKSKSDILQSGDSHSASKEREDMLVVFKDKFTKAGIFSKITTLHGVPPEKIIEHANNHSFDCLIIGSRGRSLVQTMLLGSVSYKVLKYVQIPVLLVK